MSESQHQYGTNLTSVKVHHAPGGQSNFSLGWDEPQPQPQRREYLSEAERRRKEEEEEEERRRKEEAERRAQVEHGGYKANPVQTSVKVRNPPGGQSSITFG